MHPGNEKKIITERKEGIPDASIMNESEGTARRRDFPGIFSPINDSIWSSQDFHG
jgi:hypothetical protein